jgi:uncharacterized membrane protein HdeD (DUF308 family)
MHRQFDIFVGEAPDVLAVHWGWLIALGVGLVVLGFIAIWRARAATLISVGFLGVLLLVSAVAVLAFAFSLAGYWTDFFVHVLWAVLLGIIGLILVTRPAISAEAITLVIAFYFIATGVLGIGYSLSSHIEGEWLYVLDGLVSTVLGCLLLGGWPFSGLWAIGLFIGIDLILKGSSIIALGLSVRAISA